MNLGPTELQILADLVQGGPLYLRRADRQVVAYVSQVIIQDRLTLLLRAKFLDARLEESIQDDDFVNEHYHFLDPVECVLYDPH